MTYTTCSYPCRELMHVPMAHKIISLLFYHLLIRCRLFGEGYVVKGTLLKKVRLPPPHRSRNVNLLHPPQPPEESNLAREDGGGRFRYREAGVVGIREHHHREYLHLWSPGGERKRMDIIRNNQVHHLQGFVQCAVNRFLTPKPLCLVFHRILSLEIYRFVVRQFFGGTMFVMFRNVVKHWLVFFLTALNQIPNGFFFFYYNY